VEEPIVSTRAFSKFDSITDIGVEEFPKFIGD